MLTYADGSGSLVVDPETLPIELILVSFGAACFLACVGLLTILGLPRLVRESIYVLRDEAGAWFAAGVFFFFSFGKRVRCPVAVCFLSLAFLGMGKVGGGGR